MVISGKGFINSLCLKAKAILNKCKKARYDIRNVSKKDLSNIIREFGKVTYEIYDRKRTKHEPTDSYFYLARHITNYMMKADALNLRVYPIRTEMNATKQIPTSHVDPDRN